MGIFDGIIAQEQEKTTNTNTIVADNTEEELLIIDDNVGDSILSSDITSSDDIPNSAISFFDEPKIIITEEVSNSEANLFGEKFSETTNENLITQDKIPANSENFVETKIEETGFGKIDNTHIISQTDVANTGNPNEVLINAITSLEGFLAGHEETIGHKMDTIEAKQEEITKLKQDIKVLNEEAKIIAEEKMKVEKMIELFKSQRI